MTPERTARGMALLGRRGPRGQTGDLTRDELDELELLQSEALAEMHSRAESPLRAGPEFAPNAPARADVPRPQLDGSDYLEAERSKEARAALNAIADRAERTVTRTLSTIFADFFARLFNK